MGWGGIIAGALAGAVSGAGEAGYQDIIEREKIAAQKERDETLARLSQQTHAANTQTDINAIAPRAAATTAATVANQPALDAAKLSSLGTLGPAEAKQAGAVAGAQEEAKMPSKLAEIRAHPMAPGSTIVSYNDDGSIKSTYQAPGRKREDDLSEALAEKYRAEAEAIRGGKGSKADLPSIKGETDNEGNKVLVDQRSGYLGHIVAGKPAVPGDTNWFGVKTSPDKPATPYHIEWTDADGKPVKLEDRYPALLGKGSTFSPGGTTPSTPGGRESGGAIKGLSDTTKGIGGPAGGKLVGYKGTKAVYEMPDGSKVIEQ